MVNIDVSITIGGCFIIPLLF